MSEKIRFQYLGRIEFMGDNAQQYLVGGCSVIHSIDNGLHHISLSNKHRLPTYEEMKTARYRICPDVKYMAQIFPPESEFINVHPNCLHLYELEQKELPQAVQE